MIHLLSAILMASGFRLFGWKQSMKPLGMTALCLGGMLHGDYWWQMLPIILSLFLLRWWLPTKPWLAMIDGNGDYVDAFMRATPIMLYALVLFVGDNNLLHMLTGYILVALVPFIYYLSSKQKKFDSTAVSEIIVGALLGVV